MSTGDGTVTLGVVEAPPAEPPQVGLIASLGTPGPGNPYLLDDDGKVLPTPGYPGSPNGVQRVRWYGGFQYAPEQTCLSGIVTDPCVPGTLSIQANPDTVKAMPMMVWAGDKCSTLGWAARDYRGRALRGLLAVESKQIAAELWTGAQAQESGWPNRWLASPLADTLTSGPVSPHMALMCLEQALGQCSTGARGMIHCTRQLGAEWSTMGNTLRSVGGLILTYNNTVIVPDAGYDGSGPDGQPAVSGSQWAYATLMVQVRRGPVEVIPDTFAEATIRGTNDIEWRANRLAAVSWPTCCHLAVQVDLPLCLVGGVS